MGFLAVLIAREHFRIPIILNITSTLIYILLSIYSGSLKSYYVIPDSVYAYIRNINIFLGMILLMSEIILFTFRVTNAENRLEILVKEKTKELEKEHEKVYNLQNHMINSLANLVENRDSDTGDHIMRTSNYVEMLARKAFEQNYYKSLLDEEYIEMVKRVAPMHDIGKIVVSDAILKKPGKLTEEEYQKMKEHTIAGKRIVNEVISVADNKKYVKMAENVAAYHHERWDGKGYPEGLKGEQIPLCARMMAIADVFDALVSVRCYKKSMSCEQAFSIIKEESGTHFDPQLVDIFLSMKEDVEAISKI